MFRFAVLVLAGIGLGALFFGGAESAAFGVGFLALIPLFILMKLVFIGLIFGAFARRGYRNGWNRGDFRPPWTWTESSGRRSSRPTRDERPSETDRFEEWHRMAHAKEEVDSWAPEPE